MKNSYIARAGMILGSATLILSTFGWYLKREKPMATEIRKVERVLKPTPPNWVGDGFYVHNFFPNGYRLHKRMSPFFLFDYNALQQLPPSDTPRGVGSHPHRGFETVTVALHGGIAHHDSGGNSGEVGEGGVQWMTAGSGVLHKEYHSEDFTKKGGPFQMVQIWVNLPAKHKMTTPKYQDIPRTAFGVHEAEGVKVEVISGNFKNTAGAAEHFTPVELYRIYLKKGAKLAFELPDSYNTALLATKGSSLISGAQLPLDHMAIMENKGSRIEVEATEEAELLVLSGEPIDEPIAHYGPFLMNTQAEIQQAIRDFQSGKFGTLN